ncbi:N-6 DNA methylase [Candidatus Parvarchaeota archaeon]|nr:N-6 DNA methylase [Candidatus Parvarchaeota archaeon]
MIDKDKIKQLVDKYYSLEKEGKLKDYNEEMTKKDFILPLFKSLGWDTENSKEVSAEETIKNKRVDYGFKIEGIPKFFLEAKSLKDEDIINLKYVQQAIDYAWMKSCRWAVLTNFRTLVIYNAEERNKDPRLNRFLIFSSPEDYLKDDRIFLLSKESFEKGELDKQALEVGKAELKKPVDKALLDDITNFREILYNNIKKNNQDKKLNDEDIEEAVQRIIDRMIFIRSAEDKGLEPEELRSKIREWSNNKSKLLEKLSDLYKEYDNNYNSKLFAHYRCDDLKIDDDVLNTVINGLYESKDGLYRYDFSLLSADILGNIYEQYLGRILKKVGKNSKLEASKTKRKSEGIYYTPTYIVDYIIKNTVGEYIKTHKEKDIDNIKILDPACGSGSFLLKAYDTLENYWKEKSKLNETKLEEFGSYSKKVDIVTKNIFGVDLDEKAVEIAQLNLLLKITEKRKRLPKLQENIKNGNSLIDDEKVSDKAFNWNKGFADIIKNGGFDIIVGNPPYINMQTMGKKIQKFFLNSSEWKEVYRGQSDILYYFLIKGLKLLKNGGYLGFITSRYWLENKWADKLRQFILNNAKIIKVIDFRDYYIFQDANIHTCIIILQKETNIEKREKNKIGYKVSSESPNIISFLNDWGIALMSQDELSEDSWVFNKDRGLIQKIENNSTKLGELCFVSKGMDTGLNKAFIIDRETIKENNIERAILRRIIKNSDIQRYIINDSDLYLIYTTDETKIEDYPNTMKWLKKFQNELTKRWEYKNGHCSWFRLSTLRSKELFDNAPEKIFSPYRSETNRFALDKNKFYGMTDTTIIVKRKSKIDHLYLIGVLNSNLMGFYISITGKKKGKSYEYFADYLKKLPIKIPSKNETDAVINLVNIIIDKQKKIDDKIQYKFSRKLEEDIQEIYKNLNELVYKIYGITNEEKKIIEESLK